jgi:hypothetical protein
LNKKWDIIIPLKDIAIDRWRVDEITRRKQISGIGGSYEEYGIGVGTGVIHDSGKAHNLVVAYIDQNSIPQEPRFGVPSLGGKAVREWSIMLYEKVVEAKKLRMIRD